jgi:multidrug efflux pump subunit AcrB
MIKGLIEYGIHNKFVTYFICFLLFCGGIASFFGLGQLEDPTFTIKTAMIVTRYPGASPEEVDSLITENLERVLQRMVQIKHLYSISRAGESLIRVDIKDSYTSDMMPQIWDELRKNIADVGPFLPSGVQQPMVLDDFGFVYGFLLALTGEGYSYRELDDYADMIRKELSLVKDVARIDFWGKQTKAVYIDVSSQRLAGLKLSPETFLSVLRQHNEIVDAGSFDKGGQRLRFSVSGEFFKPEDIGDLLIKPRPLDLIGNISSDTSSATLANLSEEAQNVIRIKNLATVRRGYVDPPQAIMRHNGKPAIGIAIAGSEEANIVHVGNRLTKKMDEILARMPVGLEFHKISWQSEIVKESVDGFILSLIASVVIVFAVLIIPMGMRLGLIIGFDLVLTILATFIFMYVTNTPMQRMSLGALVLAAGMMIDNTLVLADSISLKLREGRDRIQAAVETTTAFAWPLLASTLIAILAFFPIFIARSGAGEYCRTLFTVITASLTISWLIAMLITPVQCLDILPLSNSTDSGSKKDSEFQSPFFRRFRKVLEKLIQFRFATALLLVAAFALSSFAFQFVPRLFFPDSTRPQLMVDFWGPNGMSIQKTSAEIEKAESSFLKFPGVESISTFVGQGPPRFYLPVDSELPYPNYGQMIVNFDSFRSIQPFVEKAQEWISENPNSGMLRFRKYTVGPGNAWRFDAKLLAPYGANDSVQRQAAHDFLEIVAKSPYGTDWRLDEMNPSLQWQIEFDQHRARWATVSRRELSTALKRSYDGLTVGFFREGTDFLPIIIRPPEYERNDLLAYYNTLPVKTPQQTFSVPASQVISSDSAKWESPLLMRWDGKRQIAVQGIPKPGYTYSQLKDSIESDLEKFQLPKGTEIFWGGEEESTRVAQESLIPGMIPSAILIVLLLITIFNAYRPVLIILLALPFAFIGICLGLLVTQIPFGFMALLGAMSLAGMMNKNIVILLDAASENIKAGMSHYKAITEAAITRVRPILLGAATTVLGVVPLLPDVFWKAMAVTIMSGLAIGSLISIFAVPVIYCILYRAHPKKSEEDA